MNRATYKVLLISFLVLNGHLCADTIVFPPQKIICSDDKTLPPYQKCTSPDGQVLQYLKPNLDEGVLTGTYIFNSGAYDGYSISYYYKNISDSSKPGVYLSADPAKAAIQNDQAWQETSDMTDYYHCQAPVEECAFIYPFNHPPFSK